MKTALFKAVLGLMVAVPCFYLTPVQSNQSVPGKNSPECEESSQPCQAGESPQAAASYDEELGRAEAEVATREADPETGQIYGLLRNREGPLLGIKWGGQIYLDLPANDEPVDSNPTLRRARVSLQKGFGANWRAKLSLELASGSVELRDNYLEYSGWNTRLARVGVFDQPFSLESMSVSAASTFMEPSLVVAALSPGKSGGIGIINRSVHGILTSGLFFRTPKQDGLGETGEALAFRYVRAPLLARRSQDSHVGVSFSYRADASSGNSRYRTRPETGVTDENFVDTGKIAGADKILRLGFEASRVSGPFSVQSELMALKVRRNDFSDVLFWGGYVYASWFLTGESRNYDAGTGRFRQVKPLTPLGRGGKGSFELAARFSYVDLTDKDVVGGAQSNITLGLNWRPTENWRVMGSLIKVLDVNRPGSTYDGQDPLILSLRLQWEL